MTYGFPEFERARRLPSLIRWLTYVVVLILCAAAWQDLRAVNAVEAMQASNAEAINLAGRQRMASQRLAYLATAITGGAHDASHRQSLLEAADEAVMILTQERERLQAMPLFSGSKSVPSVAPITRAHAHWRQSLTPPVSGSASADAERALDQLTWATEAFLPAMNATLADMQERARSGAVDIQRTHGVNMLALVLAVSALALGAGERLARTTQAQQRRLGQQAAELERLALVAERTDNAVITADAEGRITWANDAFTRLSGYALHEVLGRKPGSILQFEGTDPQTRATLTAALSRREPVQVRILNRAKTGRLYWLHLDIQPIKDDDGRCRGFIAVETDITEQTIEQQRLQTLLRTLPAGVVEQGPDGRITDCNPEACRILGLTRDQMLGRASVDERWRTLREDGSPFPGDEHPAMVALREARAVRGVAMGVALPHGDRHWLRVNSEPVFGPDGRVRSVVSSFVDITETSAQRRLLSLTVDAAGLGTWDWHVPSGVVRFNDQWWAMLGHEAGRLPDALESWQSLVHPEDLPEARRQIERHFADPEVPYRCEFRMRTAHGAWMWIMSSGAVIERQEDGSPLRMAGIHLDISQRKSLERRLEDAAMTDALTGMPNRAALQERLRQCAASVTADASHVYAVLFMDFDRFKQVNDSLGHEAGDELLRQIAARLRATLRPGDDLARLDGWNSTAARLGGDEFVVLLDPLRRSEDAALVAQRLLDALAKPYLVQGHEVSSTVSIGIVTSERHDHDPEAMLRDADTAMYEAKRRGRGRFVVFSEDMHDRVRAALDMEGELRRAIESGEGLHVAYQPVVEIDGARMVGVEALVRWTHPAKGAIPPSEFVPLAEESRLIEDLGHFVLTTACADMARLRRELGPQSPAHMAVNLSLAQLRRPGLVDDVADALGAVGLPARALRLEVTESLSMEDVEVAKMLLQLKALGVSIALDDFGTGYSSLASLDQLPVDVVKIDRSFVDRMQGSAYQTALIEATLKVAGSLGLEVVAEGVERAEQARSLTAAGCRYGQGWLFGRPMPFTDLLERCRQPPSAVTP